MNKKQGGNFAALSPTDFIAAVTQHIPELVRYYAWYSNKARGVRPKTGARRTASSEEFSGIWAYSPTPRAVRRSRSPSTSRSTNDLPAVENEDIVYQPF